MLWNTVELTRRFAASEQERGKIFCRGARVDFIRQKKLPQRPEGGKGVNYVRAWSHWEEPVERPRPRLVSILITEQHQGSHLAGAERERA